MNMNDYIKKRVSFFIVSSIFILIITIVTSFAMGNNDLNSKVENGDEVKVIYKDDSINISEMPYTLEEGLFNSEDNIINIENRGHSDKKICLRIKGEEGTLPLNIFYASINNSQPQILNNNCLYETSLTPSQKIELNVKVWMGIDLIDNSLQGGSISLKFVVTK